MVLVDVAAVLHAFACGCVGSPYLTHSALLELVLATAGPQPSPVRQPVTPASANEPHVQVTLRISTDTRQSANVVTELEAASVPNGSLLHRLQGQGMGASRLVLASHGLYNVRSRAPCLLCLVLMPLFILRFL